jgi:hypothetical protein
VWRIKIVSIIDEHTRGSAGGTVELSIAAEHLINRYDHLAAHRGSYPADGVAPS